MTTDAQLIAAVIGSPVTYSLSPVIHAAAFASAGRSGKYMAIDCTPDDLATVLADLTVRGVVGLSVTMPLKEEIISHLDELSPDARFLSAVNCVAVSASGLAGHNTDGEGCCDALTEQGRANLHDSVAVVLGAGGTARSIALSLVRRGAHVVVVNRTVERASELVSAVSALGARGTIRVGTEADVDGASILVNATSVGMNSSEMPIDASHLHSGLVVLDAVYSPMETALLAAARGTGATVVDGLWMLIQQARHQQMLWFGENPSAGAMRVAAEQELSRRHK